MLPKYPYYCLQILIPILSSATIQIVRKAWVEGKTTLGTEEVLQEDVFTFPTKLESFVRALVNTRSRLTAKRYQHKSKLYPQHNSHL